MNKLPVVIIVAVLCSAGCQWTTLSISTSYPVYFGSSSIHQDEYSDSIGTVMGYFTYEKGSAFYMEGGYATYYFDGGEYELRFIEDAIEDALEARRDRFVSDTIVRINTRTGFSGVDIIFWLLGQLLVGDVDEEESESEAGVEESFILKGTVRQVREVPHE